GLVKARDVHLTESQAGFALVGGNFSILNGGCGPVMANGSLTIRNGGCGPVMANGDVSIENGGAGAVVAGGVARIGSHGTVGVMVSLQGHDGRGRSRRAQLAGHAGHR